MPAKTVRQKFQKPLVKRASLREVAASVQGDPFLAVVNGDPDIHYIWATQGTGDHGTVEYWESQGAGVCIGSNDPATVRTAAGSIRDGEPIIRKELVLMGMPRQTLELLREEGENGRGGRAHCQRVDKSLGLGKHPGEGNIFDPSVFRNVRSVSTELVREN
jgi:hypothetical protein